MLASLPYWFSSDSHDEAHGRKPIGAHGRRANATTADVVEPALAITHADATLAAHIRAGEEAAFSEMYLAYYAALAEYAAGMLGDLSTAHDIVQEIFLNIWHDRSAWYPGHIAAYLFRATRNRVLNHLGAKRRRMRLQTDYAQTAVEATSPGAGEPPMAPDDAIHLARFRLALDRAIDALPVARREVAILRWRHGRSLAEIAMVTGSSVKAVSMQLARTRTTLQGVVDAYVRDE